VGAEPAQPGQEIHLHGCARRAAWLRKEDFGDVVISREQGWFGDPDEGRPRRIELGAQAYNVIGRLNDAAGGDYQCLFSCRVTTPSKAVDGVRTMMAQLKEQFPDDVDYVVSLDTTLSVREGIKEIVRTLWEALLFGDPCRLHFPAEFQNYFDSRVKRLPVSLLGTFIFFSDAGLFHQLSLSFRTRLGDRPWWLTMRL